MSEITSESLDFCNYLSSISMKQAFILAPELGMIVNRRTEEEVTRVFRPTRFLPSFARSPSVARCPKSICFTHKMSSLSLSRRSPSSPSVLSHSAFPFDDLPPFLLVPVGEKPHLAPLVASFVYRPSLLPAIWRSLARG